MANRRVKAAVGSSRSWQQLLRDELFGGVRPLLLFLPVAALLPILGAGPVWRFVASGLAIIPLAGLMGEATEHLAHRLGPGIGGLLNATFGNAAELIIALFALFGGYDEVVKASITGSIVGNLLLVLGASLLAGGVRHRVQRFNKTAAGVGGTLMAVAAMGMLVPAAFHRAAGPVPPGSEHHLSVAVCVVLIVGYGLNLLFSLKTHKDLYNPADDEPDGDPDLPNWSVRRSTIVLVAATALVAWMSEILVGTVEAASHALGMTQVFVGVIVVAIVGNAAEHSTAVVMAMKDKMDLAVGIAMGSALQIALFVAPVLVLASYLRGQPMDLLFSSMEVLAVVLAVVVARMVAEDGESNWLEGAMLLMIYLIIGLAFFYLPSTGDGEREAKPEAPRAAVSLR